MARRAIAPAAHFGSQRVDGEVPGFVAASREFAGRLKLALDGVNREDRDCVVAAVRGEEPLAVRVKNNLRGVVAPLEVFRQRSDDLGVVEDTL